MTSSDSSRSDNQVKVNLIGYNLIKIIKRQCNKDQEESSKNLVIGWTNLGVMTSSTEEA